MPRHCSRVPDGEYGEVVFTTLTKEGIPVVRYRTRDISRIIPGQCACGRTFRRMERVTGRSDDMLIIRGVNVFPSQIEQVLAGIPGVAPHYQVVLTKQGSMDHVEVHVEVAPDIAVRRGPRARAHAAQGRRPRSSRRSRCRSPSSSSSRSRSRAAKAKRSASSTCVPKGATSMIEQLSVFLENTPGRLAELARALGDAGINMRALMVADTEEFGVVRIICDRPETR